MSSKDYWEKVGSIDFFYNLPGCFVLVVFPILLIFILIGYIVNWLDDRMFNETRVITKTVRFSLLLTLVGTVYWVFFGDTGTPASRLGDLGEIFLIMALLPWMVLIKWGFSL